MSKIPMAINLLLMIHVFMFSLFTSQTTFTCDPNLNYLSKGNDFFDLGQFEEAIPQYTCAIAVNPQEPQNYFFRAAAFSQTMQVESALKDLDKVIELSNGNLSLSLAAYVGKGDVYYLSMDFGRSIANYTRVIETTIEGSNTDILSQAYAGRGEAFVDIQEYEFALTDFNKAIELNPRNAVAIADRGFLYQELGNLEKAKSDWESATKVDELIADYYFKISSKSYRLEHYKRSATYSDRSIQLRPIDYAPDYFLRGFAYFELGEYKVVIAALTHALEIEPEEWQPLFIRGRSYLELKQFQDAVNDFTIYIEKNLLYPDAYLYRAESFYGLKDYDAALLDYKSYVRIVVEAGMEPVSIALERIDELENNTP